MPIYEYHCHTCGKEFELLIRGADYGSACPGCGSDEIDKKFSVFGMKSSSGFSSSTGSSCGGCGKHSCVGCEH